MRLLRLLPRFQQAYRSLDELAARETWTRDQIDLYQLERLNELWRHATIHVRHYREIKSRLKLPESFCSLSEFTATVPVLPKSEVRQDPGAFLSQPLGRGYWHRTGGSTGTPMSFFWDHDAHHAVLRARY